ncbi:hypothetical protein M501DRAFT_1004032 [Patellaria atrata CBS 101060]|uniref:RING-type domain-containing protein n=1 Tax=Patellaria atrata CBS 101060 TaxID=1346257 RepID=A0A9P4SB36_9PEZI|nr:hypothetical protein M501DRAFT_1004032 [Patellaria atrata CBS 101060]
MAARGLHTVTIAFPDPALHELHSDDFEQVSSDISFEYDKRDSIRTLSTNTVSPGDDVSGLLYVPTLPPDAITQCKEALAIHVPDNATTRNNLPEERYELIALAPWLSPTCTLALLDAVTDDPIRAFLFYIPNDSTVQPPPMNDPSWMLGENGRWKSRYRFPVYALPGMTGSILMDQLDLYSGNVSQVPYGPQLASTFGSDSYVRLFTIVDTGDRSNLPSLWIFLLIVLGILIFVVGMTSLAMHLLQRRRRTLLRRRIANGQVDLETLGVKALTVPRELLDQMPVYTYRADQRASTQLPRDPEQTPGNNLLMAGTIHSDPPISSPTHPTLAPITTHHSVAYSQDTCSICLEEFQPGTDSVRELRCKHIYHPECVDQALLEISSLCPICKVSALPLGYCPEVITNAMVRRERTIRTMRERVAAEAAQDQRAGRGHVHRRVSPLLPEGLRAMLAHERAVVQSSPMPGDVELGAVSGQAIPPAGTVPRQQSSDGCPPDQTLSRRERGRQRVLAMLGIQREAEEEAIRRQEEERPTWRRVAGRIFPALA